MPECSDLQNISQQKKMERTAEFFHVVPFEVENVRRSLKDRNVTRLQFLKDMFFMPWQKYSVIPVDIKRYLINGLAIVATVCHVFMMFSPCIIICAIVLLACIGKWVLFGILIYFFCSYLFLIYPCYLDKISESCRLLANSRKCPIQIWD